jgi:(p)ppGpp synthase/HD superfamily hydrolase
MNAMAAALQALQLYGITHTQANRAFRVAVRSHEGQHYGPYSYGYHLRHVIVTLKGLGFTSEAHRAVAALHDVIEDTPRTAEDIERRFGKDVAEAVQMLTRRADVPLHAYVAGMNELAFAVKLADRYCNLRALGRMSGQRNRDRNHRLPKYEGEMRALMQHALKFGRGFVRAATMVVVELRAARTRLTD